MPLPSEVFVSHSDHDRAFVGELCEVLGGHGVPYWYSRRELRGAQQWHDEIGSALARCDWFLIVLSPAAVASMWVKRELQYALRERRYENRILPVLLEPCDYERLSWTLSGFQLIDVGETRENAFRQLLRTWGLAFRT